MHDPWMDRLSDYIDGDLDAGTRAALEAHLSACDVCRATLAELRDVISQAGTLPAADPGTDLWPGIAAAIADSGATGQPLTVVQGGSSHASPRNGRHRFSFSAPQLAAAAMLLMALSGGAVWLLTGGATGGPTTSGVIMASSGAAGERSTRLVETGPGSAAAVRGYDAELAELEGALDSLRGRLDPATIEVLERSALSIDRAIDEAQRALASDPGNPYLHRQLDNSMRKKVELLRRANGISRGAS